MAGLAESGSNPDVELLYDINGLAKDAPRWFDRGWNSSASSGC